LVFLRLFWKQVNAFKCGSSECSQSQHYCEDCVKHKILYVKILDLVWRIASVKFCPKINDLFSFSSKFIDLNI
jgi:hypothetical protein